jgi:hypothetical protein
MNIYKYTSNDECIINLEEQEEIVEWVKNNYIKLNSNGFNRYMGSMDKINNIPPIVWEIKKRIVEKEQLENAIPEPLFRDSIGCMMDGGQLHTHTDPNKDGLIHTRFNLYVQLPIEGGFPIYAGKTLKLKERTYICCRAGVDPHSCEKVIGSRERIIISYGFLLPPSRVKNILYEYND